MTEVRRVQALAAASLLVLVIAGLIRVFSLPAVAPRINVRWAGEVDDRQRGALERELGLTAGERREGSTWAYDLTNPSWRGVKALIAHPAVADTHYINRRWGLVAADAPRGTTAIEAGGIGAWRDSALVAWARRFALALLAVSLLWLLTTGRTARHETIPQTPAST
jgi:hypothetical protein